jgi:squalene-associated FAD-dependent desaturase
MTRLAVVGGGWAGLSAAVRATQQGERVTLFEMSRTLGGRARTVERGSEHLDNGQHILIGAYVRTLELMRQVGVDPQAVLARLPLALVTPDGRGLRLPGGAPMLSFARGVLAHSGWRMGDRLRLLLAAGHWAAQGFRCEPGLSVAALCRGLPAALNRELVEPLCVAALNTPAAEASAAVFLRVLRDALFSGPGSADLLLPRRPLGDLLPDASARWLQSHGATLRLGTRIQQLERQGGRWQVDGEGFDGVVVACSAAEAARLLNVIAPEWSRVTANLRYEPIITVTVDAPDATLASAMVSLPLGPAQFAFDHGAIGARPGRFTFVISGAQHWVDAGLDAAEQAVLAQARAQLPAANWPREPSVVATLAERRATFRCTPGLARPAASVAAGLAVAGDFVDGPYPATLEGAVRSGEAAVGLALR